jgi:tRNA G18 (ribose-2'-O)-methylase SpoU
MPDHKNSFELFQDLKTDEIYNTITRPVIIADNLRTPENMGSVLRLAGNIGAQKTLFISDSTHQFKNYKINKTASGAAEKTNWKIINFNEFESEIPDGFQLILLETTDLSSPVYDFKFSEKTAFVIGNEVTGIRQDLLDKADHVLHIPIPGPVSSLNTTHALSIALFEWYRQMVKIS